MQTTLKGLYAITRDSQGDSQRLLAEVEAALRGGASIIQYRNKSGGEKQRLNEARQILKLCRHYAIPLVINDDILLAKRIGAAGVHLGRDDADLQTAREILGQKAVIGVSCYNKLELAEQAEAEGANYIAFGSFFDSPTKPAAVKAEQALLQRWKKHRIPACAIGGITPENASALIASGADMIAIISSLWETDDIEQQARTFSELFNSG